MLQLTREAVGQQPHSGQVGQAAVGRGQRARQVVRRCPQVHQLRQLAPLLRQAARQRVVAAQPPEQRLSPLLKSQIS